ncbi:MAG: hypothetical protein HY318_16085 [Armatimonadetes bacterium]|nr:hypothetical protein [Armatimonadota bacterium]
METQLPIPFTAGLVRRCWGLLLAIVCVIPAPHLRAAKSPRVQVTSGEVVVGIGDQELSVARDDAVIQLKSPLGRYILEPSIQQGTGWTRPGKLTDKPRIVKGKARVEVELRFPVVGERQFLLLVSVRSAVPVFFVTSRLTVLSGPSGQYYYWQSNASSKHYVSPGERGSEVTNFNVRGWDPIECKDWWFLPGEKGGLAVLPSNAGGRAPGEAGCVFLHALPKSTVLAAGDSLEAAFGLAVVADAPAAARLSETARGYHLSPLAPWPDHQVLHKISYGRIAPGWLRESECYNLFYRPSAQWTDPVVQNKLRPFSWIIGSTPDKAALEKCHKAGFRLLHYVVYTCLLDTETQVREGGTVYSEWLESVDHETRDLKNHPDWVCIDAEGKIQKDAWGQANHHLGLLNTCLHQKGLQEAALRQVRMLMEMGYDGVFVDLAGPTVECYGPKFGRHSHPDPGKSNSQAYEGLLKGIYETVKSHGRDRIVVQNTCVSVMPGHWSYADAQMLEAFPYGTESTRRLPEWQELQWAATRHGEAVRRGKAPVLLSYFNKFTAENVREPALFSLAYAHLFGFLWADGLTLSEIPGNQNLAKALYLVRLGKPVGEVKTVDRVLYRRFENGFAALNPTRATVEFSFPVSHKAPLEDVGYDQKLTPRDGRLVLRMLSESGRLLLRTK